MIVRFQPSVRIECRAYRHAQTDGWVALCHALGRSAAGETCDRLCATIFETQHALFTDLLVEDELQPFLKNHGWPMQTELPARVPERGVNFDIPTVVTPMLGINVSMSKVLPNRKLKADSNEQDY